MFRKQIFMKKLQTIKEHNKRYEKGLETFTLGVNPYSDLVRKKSSVLMINNIIILKIFQTAREMKRLTGLRKFYFLSA